MSLYINISQFNTTEQFIVSNLHIRRASLAERLRLRFTMRKADDSEQDRSRKKTGVTYQIVSHLPKSSEQLETRESLANLAVSHGESYIGEFRCQI